MNESLTLELLDDPVLFAADREAVQQFVETGEPLDPAIAERVRARSERAVREDCQRIGSIDIQKYFHSVDEEE